MALKASRQTPVVKEKLGVFSASKSLLGKSGKGNPARPARVGKLNGRTKVLPLLVGTGKGLGKGGNSQARPKIATSTRPKSLAGPPDTDSVYKPKAAGRKITNAVKAKPNSMGKRLVAATTTSSSQAKINTAKGAMGRGSGIGHMGK